MGIPHDLPPALKPGADVSRGASFAVGSASIIGSPKDSVSSHNYFYNLFSIIIYLLINHKVTKVKLIYFLVVDSESTSEEIQSDDIKLENGLHSEVSVYDKHWYGRLLQLHQTQS